MSPNSLSAPVSSSSVQLSMRRGGPPQAQGAATPLALQSSEFEDFMNAYRPTLEHPRPPPPKPPEESKLRKFMRKSSVLNKSRKEGVQRTPNEREKSVGTEVDKKQKRPLSAVVEGTPLQTIISEPEAIPSSKNPKQSVSRTGRNGSEEQQLKVPASLAVPRSTMPRTTDQDIVSDIKIPVPASKSPITKTSKIVPEQEQPTIVKTAGPVPKSPTAKSSKLAQEQEQRSAAVPSPKPSTSKLSKSALEQEALGKATVLLPPPKNAKASVSKAMKNGGDEYINRVVPESTVVLNTASPIPKKKVSIQDDRRISAVEDALCLIISGNNIGRFLPPRHNPDPILSMRVVPIPERKYHVILEFEEAALPCKPLTSASGLMVMPVEQNARCDSRSQLHFFSWIRDSRIASMGLLLSNVEKIAEFPYVTYLVVGGGRHELSQKLNFVRDRPPVDSGKELHFLAGYEETITISRPPLAAAPEKPTDKTGFVICLYQVLPGDDRTRFEQNWIMWTGARQIYRTLPEYMGLKRMSVLKSVLPTQIINYTLLCEYSNIMDHLTDACVIIDHLRARCCGFTGIYRIIDSL